MAEAVLDFLDTTWEEAGLIKPTPYGKEHLLFLFGGLIISILLAVFLRNAKEKTRKIILLVLGLIIFLGYGLKLETRSHLFGVPFAWYVSSLVQILGTSAISFGFFLIGLFINKLVRRRSNSNTPQNS